MNGPRYEIEIKPSARRDLKRLTEPIRRRVAAVIDALEFDPHPRGATKIVGERDTYRVRVGEYRIIYRVEDARLVVLVVRVGHRRDVYRGR